MNYNKNIFKIIFTVLIPFTTINAARAVKKTCKATMTNADSTQVVNPFIRGELAKYSHLDNRVVNSKYYLKLAKLGSKDISNLTEKDIDNIQSLITKLDAFYQKSNLNTEKPITTESEPNISAAQNKELEDIELLNLENFYSETYFYVSNLNKPKTIIIFSNKLIKKLDRKIPDYIPTMIEMTKKGVVGPDGEVGIKRILTKSKMPPIYEIKAIRGLYGHHRVYGVKVDELSSGVPVIRFFTYLKSHDLHSGALLRKLELLLKTEI